MALCKRIIARLDIKGAKLVKGIQFEGVRVIGDAKDAASRYSVTGVDEILYVDTVASLYGRNGLGDLLRFSTRDVFIPITAGGGVRSLKDAGDLLSAGADKIAINTAALRRPELLHEVVSVYGSQCVVLSVQAKKIGPSNWEAMGESGRERSGRCVVEWIQLAQDMGVGEVLLTSVDRDGTCSGPDYDLIKTVKAGINVPLIVGGGISAVRDVKKTLNMKGVSGVVIGSGLHRKSLDIKKVKEECQKEETRMVNIVSIDTQKPRLDDLAKVKVGVVDYGMGNVQSLINAYSGLGASCLVTHDLEVLEECDILTLPGVGAFPAGMEALKVRSLDKFIREWALSGRPLLGVCLGMQMLFDEGEEFQRCRGLGLLEGRVEQIKIDERNGEVLPHIGWDELIPCQETCSKYKLDIPKDQYFVHSFYAAKVPNEVVLAKCQYGSGEPFPAAVIKGNIAGFQFHPERSGHSGLTLLRDICMCIGS